MLLEVVNLGGFWRGIFNKFNDSVYDENTYHSKINLFQIELHQTAQKFF